MRSENEKEKTLIKKRFLKAPVEIFLEFEFDKRDMQNWKLTFQKRKYQQ